MATCFKKEHFHEFAIDARIVLRPHAHVHLALEYLLLVDEEPGGHEVHAVRPVVVLHRVPGVKHVQNIRIVETFG